MTPVTAPAAHPPVDALGLRGDKTMPPARLDLDELLALIEGSNGERMRRLYADHRDAYAHARGSSRNHQAWPGGYWDHVQEIGNLACLQYAALSGARALPFSLSDALLILAAHDLEKMVRFAADGSEHPAFESKAAKAEFRWRLLASYEIELTPEQANAMRYAEGVRDVEYSGKQRTMGPLACFVHMCDLASARIWFNYPLPTGQDPWTGADRSRPDAAEVTVPAESFAPDGTCLGVLD